MLSKSFMFTNMFVGVHGATDAPSLRGSALPTDPTDNYYWSLGQCNYSKDQWTTPSQWCTNGYPEWSAETGDGSDASCGLKDLAGVVVGNGGQQKGCAKTTVVQNGESVTASKLFPFSSIPARGGTFNADGMKTLSVFGKPITPSIPTYTTCANNCGSSGCDVYGIPNGGENLPSCDFSNNMSNLKSACVSGVGPKEVGASKGWPPGSWPSVFHGLGGQDWATRPLPTCDNHKYSKDKADFDARVNVWFEDLWPNFQMDAKHVTPAFAGENASFMCVTDPANKTNEIKAMLSFYHGVLNQKCGDLALVRHNPEGEDVPRYIILLSTGPRTWSLELAGPTNRYIGGSSNSGGAGCAIPDAAIPIEMDLTQPLKMVDPHTHECVTYTPKSA